MDKKDEIIARQTEIIRSMTEQNLRRVSADLWGGAPPEQQTGKDAPAKLAHQTPPAETNEKTEADTPGKRASYGGHVAAYGIFRQSRNGQNHDCSSNGAGVSFSGDFIERAACGGGPQRTCRGICGADCY